MPMDMRRYPPNWREISQAVKDAAEWRCELCSIKHGTWRTSARGVPYREIVTTAHLGAPHADGRPGDPHNKMDVRPENLACLCTACHLDYDRPEHIRVRLINLRKRKVEALRRLYGAGGLFAPIIEEGIAV